MPTNEQIFDQLISIREDMGFLKRGQLEMKEDIKELCTTCKKIPDMELGLNNHLSSHNRLRNLLVYPTSVAVASGIIMAFLRLIWHIKILF